VCTVSVYNNECVYVSNYHRFLPMCARMGAKEVSIVSTVTVVTVHSVFTSHVHQYEITCQLLVQLQVFVPCVVQLLVRMTCSQHENS
jgi:ATP/ADP translocase